MKSALTALGLKCSGTLEERAGRLWETKGKEISELKAQNPKLFSKTKPGDGKTRDVKKEMEIAMTEARIRKLVELLSSVRQATVLKMQIKEKRNPEQETEARIRKYKRRAACKRHIKMDETDENREVTTKIPKLAKPTAIEFVKPAPGNPVRTEDNVTRYLSYTIEYVYRDFKNFFLDLLSQKKIYPTLKLLRTEDMRKLEQSNT